MTKVKIPPYVRASNPHLARWQSAVAEVAEEELRSKYPDLSAAALQQKLFTHPMVLGTNIHVQEAEGAGRGLQPKGIETYRSLAKSDAAAMPVIHGVLSHQFFEKERTNGLLSEPLLFPDSDYAYLQWAKVVVKWGLFGNPIPGPYRSVKENGGPVADFGVIQIPNDAKVAILGDFATGLNDATTLLIAMLRDLQPDFIVHLGDIYYSGSEQECKTYVATFDYAFSVTGRKVPVFSLPGNHDYYSGGWGFFKSVLEMNAKNGFPQYAQPASYFCLRTENANWQLLGMDTGYNSVHNYQVTKLGGNLEAAYAPWLEFDEAAWHQNKLTNFPGRTILMSHHQLFSSDAVINDGDRVVYQQGTNVDALTYLNGNLLQVFKDYLPKVAAWFWGHEHTLNIFKDNQAGLSKARLVGNSGYEEWEGENPYKHTDSPYSDLTPEVEVGVTPVSWNGQSFNFLNHGFALLTLKAGQACVDYYEYPVFNPHQPIPADPPPISKVDFRDASL
ncbi:MAG: metallophosphoesterase [Lewinella sp.]